MKNNGFITMVAMVCILLGCSICGFLGYRTGLSRGEIAGRDTVLKNMMADRPSVLTVPLKDGTHLRVTIERKETQ